MKTIVTPIRAALAVIGIGLALSGCRYNTIPTLQEQAKARLKTNLASSSSSPR